jgi:microsomal dipeptidase-like Zn-dependent dipeptidase
MRLGESACKLRRAGAKAIRMRTTKWIAIITAVLAAILIAVFSLAPRFLENSMNVVVPHPPWPVSESAKNLHQNLVIADLHADTLLWARDPLVRSDIGHVDVPRLQAGNVALQIMAAVTKSPRGQNYQSNTADTDNITPLVIVQRWPVRTWTSLLERALYQAQRLQQASARAPEQIVLIRTSDELATLLAARARGADTVGALLATEGAHPLEGKLANVQRLADAGYRVFGLQHFFDNALGGSLHGTSKAGLTEFGIEVVLEIDRLGLIIDVAHSSPAVVEDVLALIDSPIMVSHTGMKGACDTPRNLSDALFERIAQGGGLIGIGYWDAVCDITPQGVARSIRYAVDVVGVNHVALGSDYDGTTTVTFDAAELSALTQALLDVGLSESAIALVMGGNAIDFLLKKLPPSILAPMTDR